MNLVADEGIDAAIVERLRADGFAVAYIAELEAGLDDEAILDLAAAQQAVLLTSDKDFGELVYRQGLATTGVVLIRLAGLSASRKADLASTALAKHSSELAGCFTVIRPGNIRLRRPSV